MPDNQIGGIPAQVAKGKILPDAAVADEGVINGRSAIGRIVGRVEITPEPVEIVYFKGAVGGGEQGQVGVGAAVKILGKAVQIGIHPGTMSGIQRTAENGLAEAGEIGLNARVGDAERDHAFKMFGPLEVRVGNLGGTGGIQHAIPQPARRTVLPVKPNGHLHVGGGLNGAEGGDEIGILNGGRDAVGIAGVGGLPAKLGDEGFFQGICTLVFCEGGVNPVLVLTEGVGTDEAALGDVDVLADAIQRIRAVGGLGMGK